jgi:hypothetical protein
MPCKLATRPRKLGTGGPGGSRWQARQFPTCGLLTATASTTQRCHRPLPHTHLEATHHPLPSLPPGNPPPAPAPHLCDPEGRRGGGLVQEVDVAPPRWGPCHGARHPVVTHTQVTRGTLLLLLLLLLEVALGGTRGGACGVDEHQGWTPMQARSGLRTQSRREHATCRDRTRSSSSSSSSRCGWYACTKPRPAFPDTPGHVGGCGAVAVLTPCR